MTTWSEGVSALVPVLNDALRLPEFFRELSASEVLDVVVCDLGSTDDSIAIARQAGAHVVRATTSLGEAFNTAAQNARGSIFWFLPPACVPAPESGAWIRYSLPEYKAVGGYWKVRCQGGGLAGAWRKYMRHLAFWRGNSISLEQAPFISRETFQAIGGIPAGGDTIRLLTRRVREQGRLIVMDAPIICHAASIHKWK